MQHEPAQGYVALVHHVHQLVPVCMYWYTVAICTSREVLYILGESGAVCSMSQRRATLHSRIMFISLGMLSRINSSTSTPSFRYFLSSGYSLATFRAYLIDYNRESHPSYILGQSICTAIGMFFLCFFFPWANRAESDQRALNRTL